ncbi:unnamed protein product [Rotaria magnacalcarata]|uniref:Uncharacterized protein n=1 Tax=Rotaria magnacalcarata TaxID=392030 RepID=A0A816L721_9BILA|nr:unnamed protein product [Rotaria magnacalcarata]CAF3854734.1 unnamed protein product [Rotaria magnacalcarata]CAF3976511.1 unnamed protein product [Rotaria magnacalcarata]CAF4309278.1 unnamed protein product [Rotaria magnacalcarata]CAF4384239.1 unnamed protein product [Rotaria magnacalcarata]
MMPTFNIVSGVIGLLAALLFLIAGISHLKKKDGSTWTIIALIGGFITYGFLIPWYMYGGTLTSVDKSAKFRQSTNSSDSATYCISYIQQSIDGIVLLYWISMKACLRILGKLVGSVSSNPLKVVSFEIARQNASNDVLKSLAG